MERKFRGYFYHFDADKMKLYMVKYALIHISQNVDFKVSFITKLNVLVLKDYFAKCLQQKTMIRELIAADQDKSYELLAEGKSKSSVEIVETFCENMFDPDKPMSKSAQKALL